MRRFPFPHAGLLATGLLLAGPAGAVVITNHDSEARTVEVVEGDSVTEATLKPGETRSDLCEAGCDLRVGESDLYDLEGSETLTIRANRVSADG